MRPALSGSLVIALLVVGCARDARPPNAQKLLDLGTRLYEDRTFDMAIERLEASMALEVDVRAAVLLAECYERLDRDDEARRAWRLVERMSSGSLRQQAQVRGARLAR